MVNDIIDDLKSRGIAFSHRVHAGPGYHGTSVKCADLILSRGFSLDLANPDAWLGKGIYFFDNEHCAGTRYALCFAIYRLKGIDPVVLRADLGFGLLLDLNDARNEVRFWLLHRLLKSMPEFADDVDEHFVAFFIGTHVAEAMGSDGVGWKFPLSEPKKKRKSKHRKQRGFAVKKLNVIGPVSRCA